MEGTDRNAINPVHYQVCELIIAVEKVQPVLERATRSTRHYEGCMRTNPIRIALECLIWQIMEGVCCGLETDPTIPNNIVPITLNNVATCHALHYEDE